MHPAPRPAGVLLKSKSWESWLVHADDGQQLWFLLSWTSHGLQHLPDKVHRFGLGTWNICALPWMA